MENDLFLTLEEVCEIYKTSATAVRRKVKQRQLPAHKPFGKILFKREDLEKLMKRKPAA